MVIVASVQAAGAQAISPCVSFEVVAELRPMLNAENEAIVNAPENVLDTLPRVDNRKLLGSYRISGLRFYGGGKWLIGSDIGDYIDGLKFPEIGRLIRRQELHASHKGFVYGRGSAKVLERYPDDILFIQFHVSRKTFEHDPSSLICGEIVSRICPHKVGNDGVAYSGNQGRIIQESPPPWYGIAATLLGIFGVSWGRGNLRRDYVVNISPIVLLISIIVDGYGFSLVLPWSATATFCHMS
jgi:hypothetical protein